MLLDLHRGERIQFPPIASSSALICNRARSRRCTTFHFYTFFGGGGGEMASFMVGSYREKKAFWVKGEHGRHGRRACRAGVRR